MVSKPLSMRPVDAARICLLERDFVTSRVPVLPELEVMRLLDL